VAVAVIAELIVFSVDLIMVETVVDWAWTLLASELVLLATALIDKLIKRTRELVLVATGLVCAVNERKAALMRDIVAGATIEETIERAMERTKVVLCEVVANRVRAIAATRTIEAGALMDEDKALKNALTRLAVAEAEELIALFIELVLEADGLDWANNERNDAPERMKDALATIEDSNTLPVDLTAVDTVEVWAEIVLESEISRL
jgi:hypothetical protein